MSAFIGGIENAKLRLMPSRRRRRSDWGRDILVVVLSDGTRLRCSLYALEREVRPRWMIIDVNGTQFRGPFATPDRSPSAVRQLIEEWWAGSRS
jgi:hypothetical protein